ncbi:MAG: NAD(P)-binding domain-containing protein [Planctomycetes bacterium]|nr:NAD(P)-binding domain-containing protein [Planctomycetota bacterium]
MNSLEAANTASIDVAIVGAGPIGLEMAAALKRTGVDYVHLEAGQTGHTFLTRWPPNTRFFSSPELVAIAGVPLQTIDQEKCTREDYLAYLRGVVQQFDLKVNVYERVILAKRDNDGFTLRTSTRTGDRLYRCRRLVLASGGMAAPNRLDVPGEDLPHVSYSLGDPHRYFRTRLLVVGGMNSALESALRSWRAGADVTISYRRAELGRGTAKQHLVGEVGLWVREGRIRFLPETVPVEITPEHVVLAPTRDGRPCEGERIRHPADFVLLSTGFVADMSLFEQLGVELDGPRKVPQFSPETMETNVPGVYVAGTATGGTQTQYKQFIETGHVHVERIAAAMADEFREDASS